MEPPPEAYTSIWDLPVEIHSLFLRLLSPVKGSKSNPLRIAARTCLIWCWLAEEIHPSRKLYVRDLIETPELVRWAVEEGWNPCSGYGVCTLAVKERKWESFRELSRQGFPVTRYSIKEIMKSGNLPLLREITQEGRPLKKRGKLPEKFLRSTSLEILDWLLEKGFRIDENCWFHIFWYVKEKEKRLQLLSWSLERNAPLPFPSSVLLAEALNSKASPQEINWLEELLRERDLIFFSEDFDLPGEACFKNVSVPMSSLNSW